MNDKQEVMNKIVDIVVDCTTSRINEVATVTRDDLLGMSRNENHVMARSLLALQLKHEGFTTTSIALLLKRTEQAIRQMYKAGYDNVANNRICRKAAAQIVIECDKLLSEV